MTRTRLLAFVLIVFISPLAAVAAPPESVTQPAGEQQDAADVTDPLDRPNLWERERVTEGWLGFLQDWSEKGLDVTVGVTNIYQQNFRGGQSTHRKSGRYSGSYDLELGVDLEKLKLIPGGHIYALADGSWSEGIDEPSVGSLFGVNADAGGYRSLDLVQLWYEQRLLDERLRIRGGKIDLTGGFECQGCPVSFDGNAYANDQTLQFLNGGLVNNPQIPFPDEGLGAIVYLEPVDGFYMSLGAADAQADRRETGFNTAFHDEDYYLAMAETGITPLLQGPNGPMRGAYRVGLWYDPQDKEQFDGGTKRDDVGLYASFDQMVFKENAEEEDEQGLGLFARYGLADGDVNEIQQFWSTGLQYQGLLPGRDRDVLGAGVASGCLSDEAGFRDSHETAFELYYNIMLAPWLSLTPDFQYVANPGGDNADAVIGGVRLQIVF